jgi:hypothetical protein
MAKTRRKEVKTQMPVKRLGRPPFLSVNEVEDSDVFVIAEPPYLVDAEHSKYGRERYRIVIKKPDDREFGLRTWTLNTTTSNKLLDAFGEDEKLWIGKRIRIRKHAEFVLGKQKFVLYGEPYVDPQKPLEVEQ